MTCTVPPVRYPRSSDRFSVSATTPCPANAASPWMSTGSTVKPGSPLSMTSCLARTTPSSTGSTASRWLGLATSEVLIWLPSGGAEGPLRAEVVLDVAGPLGAARVQVALELLEDLRVGLADDVGQHVQPAAVGHADDGLVQVRLGRLGEHRVDQRDQGLGALQGEPALADELGLQEHLERLGHVEPGQDADLLVVFGARVRDLHPVLQPAALLGVLHVHVLDADGAAVRVAQHAQDVPQLHPRVAAEAAGGEVALQVPQGQAVQVDVQVGMLALGDLERVGVGHQVAAHPVGVDQLLDPGGPGHVVLVAGREVPDPADRLVRDAQRGEDLVVEAVLAEQQLVDLLQELTRLGALDDPVVVGRGERDRLADRQPGQGLLGRPGVGGRVLHRPDAHDAALARHQPRHRVLGADRARVGDRRGGALEVGDRELARAGPAHDVLVGRPELAEVHLLRRLDVRHEQLPAAVGGVHVDGQAQVDVVGPGDGRLAVLLGVGVVHLRQRRQRRDHRVPDQVRERHLAAAAAPQVVVDDDPVVREQLGRDRADAGRGGHGQAGRHVGDGARRGAAQPADLGAFGWARGRSRAGLGGESAAGLGGESRAGPGTAQPGGAAALGAGRGPGEGPAAGARSLGRRGPDLGGRRGSEPGPLGRRGGRAAWSPRTGCGPVPLGRVG